MATRNVALCFEVCRDGLTGGIQLCIAKGGGGFRIGGPKFSGTGSVFRTYPIDQRAAEEIRRYLDQEFPTPTDIKEA